MALRPILIALFVGAAIVAASACFGDLPPPALCPAPTKRPGNIGVCSGAMGQPNAIVPPGCYAQFVSACLAGGDPSCTCDELAQCPPDPRVWCYPPGDCPPAVNAVSPKVACSGIERSAIVLAVPVPSTCGCGCAGCAAACDGIGPILAMPPQPDGGAPMPFVVRDIRFPVAGRIGAYVRYRGVVSASVQVSTGTGGSGKMIGPAPDFTDAVVWDPGTPPAPAGSPAQLGITLMGPTVMEIDCIVPFIVPL